MSEGADDRSRGASGLPGPEEIEVMRLVADGWKDAAIAHHLGVSRVTVRRRVRAFCARLGVESRLQAAVIAVRRGWL